MQIITIITIRDNIVEDTFGFTDNNKAESKFVDIIIDREGNQADDELNGAIEDGYWEFKDNSAVCLSHVVTV